MIVIRFTRIFLRVFSSALLLFGSCTLYYLLMIITNVYMTCLELCEFVLLMQYVHAQYLTIESKLSFNLRCVTVFCIRLLYEALPADWEHRSPSSTRQQIWSPAPLESSSPVLYPFILNVLLWLGNMIVKLNTKRILSCIHKLHSKCKCHGLFFWSTCYFFSRDIHCVKFKSSCISNDANISFNANGWIVKSTFCQ